jgi:hypothetical protein
LVRIESVWKSRKTRDRPREVNGKEPGALRDLKPSFRLWRTKARGTEKVPTGAAGKGWPSGDAFFQSCPFLVTGCFSFDTSNLRLAISGLHGRGDISLRSIAGLRSRYGYRSIDQLASSLLVGLVGECGGDVGVVWAKGVMGDRYGVWPSARFSRLVRVHPSIV